MLLACLVLSSCTSLDPHRTVMGDCQLNFDNTGPNGEYQRENQDAGKRCADGFAGLTEPTGGDRLT